MKRNVLFTLMVLMLIGINTNIVEAARPPQTIVMDDRGIGGGGYNNTYDLPVRGLVWACHAGDITYCQGAGEWVIKGFDRWTGYPMCEFRANCAKKDGAKRVLAVPRY